MAQQQPPRRAYLAFAAPDSEAQAAALQQALWARGVDACLAGSGEAAAQMALADVLVALWTPAFGLRAHRSHGDLRLLLGPQRRKPLVCIDAGSQLAMVGEAELVRQQLRARAAVDVVAWPPGEAQPPDAVVAAVLTALDPAAVKRIEQQRQYEQQVARQLLAVQAEAAPLLRPLDQAPAAAAVAAVGMSEALRLRLAVFVLALAALLAAAIMMPAVAAVAPSGGGGGLGTCSKLLGAAHVLLTLAFGMGGVVAVLSASWQLDAVLQCLLGQVGLAGLALVLASTVSLLNCAKLT